MIWRKGVVTASTVPWTGIQELSVDLETPLANGQVEVQAISYVDLTGRGEVGDSVLVTAAGLQRRLGTGGYAFVVAFPDRLPHDPPPQPGHIMKARYTPFQTMRLGVDEEESTHHDLFTSNTDLKGLPVIGADLHSSLPAIIAGIRSVNSQARVAYIMTDAAALPYQFSRSAAELQRFGWITTSITVGQAFGGDLEAVNIYTGLLAARHIARADVAVVIQGPGNLGTGSPLGFSGTSLAEVMHATHVLNGVGVGSLRVSQADPRPRHQGISHHSTTVYRELIFTPITVVVPELEGEFGRLVREQANALADRHNLAYEPCTGLDQALEASPVRLTTMGRGIDQDASPFLAAAAAGRWVARNLLTPK